VSSDAACDRGLAFVEEHGDAFSLARARALAAGRPPVELPFPDGTEGFVAEAQLRVLGAAADLRALHLGVVECVCADLETAQRQDGSWGADGDSEERVFVRTGMIAGHLGKTRFARAATLAAAGDYLAAHFSPDLLQDFHWAAIAACANYFANVPHEEGDAVLQWTGRELERGFRVGRFDAVQCARVLLYAEAPSLPGGRLGAAEVIERLRGEQQRDGGWLRLEDPAPPARVEHTLDGLTALVRF